MRKKNRGVGCITALLLIPLIFFTTMVSQETSLRVMGDNPNLIWVLLGTFSLGIFLFYLYEIKGNTDDD